jgi:hypothetical protein
LQYSKVLLVPISAEIEAVLCGGGNESLGNVAPKFKATLLIPFSDERAKLQAGFSLDGEIGVVGPNLVG